MSNKISKKRKIVFLMKKNFLLVSVCLLSVAPVWAQHHAEEKNVDMNEVVISTTRMSEIKQNAAASVTIINSDQIVAMSKLEPDMSKLLGLLAPGMALSSNTTSSR